MQQDITECGRIGCGRLLTPSLKLESALDDCLYNAESVLHVFTLIFWEKAGKEVITQKHEYLRGLCVFKGPTAHAYSTELRRSLTSTTDPWLR